MAKEGKIIKRDQVFENSHYRVYLDDVVDPYGQRAEDYMVVEPKSARDGLATGVAVLPIFEGKYGLVQNYRHALRKTLWEIPRGSAEPTEPPSRSALRELEEETGLTTNEDQLEAIATISTASALLCAKVTIYIARNCKKTKRQIVPEFGLGNFKLFTEKEFSDLIAHEEIVDSTTLIAWLRLQTQKTAS